MGVMIALSAWEEGLCSRSVDFLCVLCLPAWDFGLGLSVKDGIADRETVDASSFSSSSRCGSIIKAVRAVASGAGNCLLLENRRSYLRGKQQSAAWRGVVLFEISVSVIESSVVVGSGNLCLLVPVLKTVIVTLFLCSDFVRRILNVRNNNALVKH
jgi:hypothetical protein